MKKQELAERAGVSRQCLAGFEGGSRAPGAETVAKLAEALSFPEAFFFAGEIEVVSPERPSFRSLSTMTSAQRDAALAAGAIAFEVARVIDEQFDLPAVDIPDLRGEPPESAAAAVRAHWGLGEAPIESAVYLLEEHGVRVFSLVEKNEEVDAFSVWHCGVPYVFLNTQKTAERSRFDAMHELAHLVLHRHDKPQGRDAEHEANRFASAFLMPEASFTARVPPLCSLPALFPLKKHFKVSIASVVSRLNQLGCLSDWEYRQLFIDLSTRGWRRDEPPPCVTPENSQVWRDVFAGLRDDGISMPDFANRVNITADDLANLVFHLVPTVIPSNLAVAPGPLSDSPGPSGGRLRLVK